MSTKNTKKQNNTLYYAITAVCAAVILALVVWAVADYFSSKPDSDYKVSVQDTANKNDTELTEENFLNAVDTSDAKKVEFVMTDGKSFVMEVYPKVAPVTAENFLKLVEEGFYNGLTFHRVIAGFMAQGGAFDPENQANDPAKSIVGEFSSNGHENNLAHFRGVVSMARTTDPDSASSQFFICYDRAEHLDGEYAAFGYVTEGMETIDSFLDAGTDENDVPLKEVKIESAKILE